MAPITGTTGTSSLAGGIPGLPSHLATGCGVAEVRESGQHCRRGCCSCPLCASAATSRLIPATLPHLHPNKQALEFYSIKAQPENIAGTRPGWRGALLHAQTVEGGLVLPSPPFLTHYMPLVLPLLPGFLDRAIQVASTTTGEATGTCTKTGKVGGR